MILSMNAENASGGGTPADPRNLTVLVVDDEQIVREFFAKVFPWQQVGLRFIGAVASGNEALEICRQNQPAVVLTDISMPGMDGLELVERIQAEFPEIACVFLTVHEDFELVQRALRLGAVDYIAKQGIVPEEMAEALKRVRERVLERRPQIDIGLQRRHWLQRILAGRLEAETFAAEASRLKLSLREAPWRLMLVQPGGVMEEDTHDAELISIPTGMNSAIDAAVRRLEQTDWAWLKTRTLAVLTNDPPNDTERLEGLFAELGQQLGSPQAPISAGFSNRMPSLHDAPAGLEEAERALESRFYLGDGRLLPCPPEWFTETPSFFQQLDRLSREAGDDMAHLLHHFEGVLESTIALFRSKWVAPDRAKVLIVHLVTRLAENFNLELNPWDMALWPLQAAETETSEDLKDWALGTLSTFIVPTGAMELRSEIRDVIALIRSQLSSPIDLAWAARTANLHPNYFSAVFHQETGQTFSDYLTRLRMERAAEYLREGTWSTQQISSMVGFSNYRTFYNAFRRLMGTNPTDFRERFGR